MTFWCQNGQKICVCEKWVQHVSCYDGTKELVRICDHVHFSRKNKWTQDCFLSPKGAGPWPKTMWHWYRKWMFSETSHFIFTVSVLSTLLRCGAKLSKRNLKAWKPASSLDKNTSRSDNLAFFLRNFAELGVKMSILKDEAFHIIYLSKYPQVNWKGPNHQWMYLLNTVSSFKSVPENSAVVQKCSHTHCYTGRHIPSLPRTHTSAPNTH